MLSVLFADGSTASGRMPLQAERTSVRRTYIYPLLLKYPKEILTHTHTHTQRRGLDSALHLHTLRIYIGFSIKVKT